MSEPALAGDAAPGDAARPAHRRRRLATAAVVALVAAAAPWWVPRALGSLSFFRVRNVEVQGVQYLSPGEVVARLRVDTSMSVWDDVRPLERRLAGHPQVRTVEVGRKLPGTLVVRVTENLPVALVPSRRGLHAVDEQGRELPIDPSRTDLDLPLAPQRDTALLRLLAEVRRHEPRLYERISEVRRAGRGELLLRLTSVPVRAMADVTVARLAELYPVERDLARRRARVAEIDLRYRDQVIARLQ